MKYKSNTMKVRTGLVLLFFMLHFSGWCQFPYSLNKPLDYSLTGLGIASVISGELVSNGTRGLTTCEIEALNSNDVNSFDRRVLANYSEQSNKISEGLMLGTAAASLGLLADSSIRAEFLTVAVMGAEAILINYGLANMTKGIALRTRPYVYNESVELGRKQEVDARYSFYSRTTATTATISFFAAKVYSDLHPNSKWKPVVWGGAILLPALTGYAKVDAGEHFITDVMVGYSVGALIGYFVPKLHLNTRSNNEIRVFPSLEGVAVQVRF